MDSGRDLNYADPTEVEVILAQYHDRPSKATTAHRSLEIQIKVLHIPPALSGDTDQDEQPPISPPADQHTHQWVSFVTRSAD